MYSNLLGFLSLTLMIITGIVWFRAAFRVSLPRNRTAYVLAVVVTLSLAAASFLTGTTANTSAAVDVAASIAAGLAALLAALFLFTVAISRQKTAADAIAVGDTIPAFTATDENGEQFDSAVLADNAVLIKFFRGHW